MRRSAILLVLITCTYLLIAVLGYLGFATYHSNLIGWFLILTSIAYGLGVPYLLWTNLKSGPVVLQEYQNRSFWAVIPGFLLVFYASPIEYRYMSELLPGFRPASLQIIGISLIIAGIFLFSWARNSLKGFYSGRVQVQVGHVLIQSGPYHIIRHPAYASYLLMSLGILIGYSSLIGFLGLLLLLLPALIYRIVVEEQLLAIEFGDFYLTYTRKTRRLVPLLW